MFQGPDCKVNACFPDAGEVTHWDSFTDAFILDDVECPLAVPPQDPDAELESPFDGAVYAV